MGAPRFRIGMEYGLELPLGFDRQTVLAAAVSELAKTKPTEALKHSLEVSPPSAREAVVAAVFDGWAKVDARAAVQYWNGHPELPSSSSGIDSLLYSLARTQPALAAELALTVRSTSGIGDYMFSSTLGAWAERDQAAMVRWAQSITDPQLRNKALGAAARALMTSDPQKGWELAKQMSPGGISAEVTRSLMSKWMDHDPDSAIAYLATLPEDLGKLAASSMGYSLGKFPPADQLRLLKLLPEGKTKSSAIGDMVRGNASAGRYVDAVNLLGSMAEGSDRDRSLHNLALEWSKKETSVVKKWIEEQPASTDRDLITSAYAANLARTDTKSAMDVALQIPDVSVRKGTLANIYATWRQTDKAAADAWFASLPGFTDRERSSARSSASGGYLYLATPTVQNRR